MRVIYYNNCWFSNVGEAFIDIGAFSIINSLWKNPKIACMSDMSEWYGERLVKRCSSWNRGIDLISGKMYEYLEADYIVMSGMFASEIYLESPGRKMVDELIYGGAKLILLGMGSGTYSEKERKALAVYYEKIAPELIITRDRKTYEMYKDYAECISGLDCAFWVKDCFDPRGFSKRKYDVHTFNRSKEPYIEKTDSLEIIRPWHMQWSTSLDDIKENYILSDTPYDYLTIYGNANRVYTDLVHATIPSLQYGVPVKYYYVDERSNAFYSVRSLNIDEQGFMFVDELDLERQKNELIHLIRQKLMIE